MSLCCCLLLASRAVCGVSAPQTAVSPDAEARYGHLRGEMVERQIAARGVSDRRVLAAMREVPREKFIPPYLAGDAYRDSPLPIGYGQTISQPYIVALMTELLSLSGEGAVVCEVGTGSGYQSAVLSGLADSVYTIEIIPELAESAAELLKELGYDNVHPKQGDGYYGWKEHAPFDGIVVTAASTHVPPPLIAQLKEGGRMVIPVGSVFSSQYLMLVEKKGGKVTTKSVIPVRFVPLTGGHDEYGARVKGKRAKVEE